MDMEKEYYNRWMQEIQKNHKLKLELEKHQKLDERLKDFEWKYFKYKKYFCPLANEYRKVFDYAKTTTLYLNKLTKLYYEFLLLNPQFNVKLKDYDKDRIIKELQLILLEYQDLEMPSEYDIVNDMENSTKLPFTTKKNFELKNFVVKKNKK